MSARNLTPAPTSRDAGQLPMLVDLWISGREAISGTCGEPLDPHYLSSEWQTRTDYDHLEFGCETSHDYHINLLAGQSLHGGTVTRTCEVRSVSANPRAQSAWQVVVEVSVIAAYPYPLPEVDDIPLADRQRRAI